MASIFDHSNMKFQPVLSREKWEEIAKAISANRQNVSSDLLSLAITSLSKDPFLAFVAPILHSVFDTGNASVNLENLRDIVYGEMTKEEKK